MPGRTLPNLADLTSFLYSTSSLYSRFTTSEKPLFSRLPPEVLREILMFAVFSLTTSEVSHNTPVISFVQGSPFPLSQVCKQWRTIIISSPFMWSTITIDSPSLKHEHRTELWLKRSMNKRLEITLRQSDEPAEAEIAATDRLIRIFSRHFQRWRTITLHLVDAPPTHLNMALANIQRSSNPQLREAEVIIETDEVPDLSSYLTLQKIEGLRKLTWNAPPFVPSAGPFGAQLQHLDIGSPIYATDLLKGIAECSKLICLTAKDVRADPNPGVVTGLVELPNLAIIILSMNPDSMATAKTPLTTILPHLRLPSLKQLQLQRVTKASPHHAPSDRAVIGALLARSQCALNVLNVDITDSSPDEILSWLSLPGIDDLETLCLAGGTIDSAILETLTWTPGAGARNRFRRLQHLGLATCSADIDEGVLLRMLGSRLWKPVDPTVVGKQEEDLRTARVWVRQLTGKMETYERMYDLSVQRTPGWATEERLLEFTEV